MASVRRFVSRHLALVAASLAAMLIVVDSCRPPQPRIVLPELDGRVAEFSADCRKILTDGVSGGCVRDAATGRILVNLRRKNGENATEITWPRFTPDGKHLIVQLGGIQFGNHRTQTVTLAIFDTGTGSEVASFDQIGADDYWNFGPEYSISADGSTLAFSPKPVSSRNGKIVVWDIDAGKTVAEFPGLPPLALTRDGRMIAHAGSEGGVLSPRVRFVSADRGARPHRSGLPRGRGLNCGPFAFSDDGKTLTILPRLSHHPFFGQPMNFDVSEVINESAARVNEPTSLRNRTPGIYLGSAPASGRHLNNVTRLSRDGTLLFVTAPFDFGGQPETYVLSIAEPTPRLVIREARSNSVAPDAGKAVTVNRHGVSRWNPETSKSDVRVLDLASQSSLLDLKETGIQSAAISPDGNVLAFPSLCRDVLATELNWKLKGQPASINHREVRLHDASTGVFRSALPLRDSGGFPELEFSPDSQSLIVRYHSSQYVNPNDPSIIDWSVELWDVSPRSFSVWSCRSLIVVETAAVLFAAASRRRRG
jgi:WD40-like Beta Propeller Repeat